MKHLKAFLIGLGTVAMFDLLWWLMALGIAPPMTLPTQSDPQGLGRALFGVHPLLAAPWLALGLFVSLAGWTRRSSTVPRIWVALGAIVGTAFAVALALHFTGCGCEPS